MLFIVADGMSGHLFGDIASQTAVKVINNCLEENISKADKKFLSKDENIVSLLEEALSGANEEIYPFSQNQPSKSIAGTTVSLLYS